MATSSIQEEVYIGFWVNHMHGGIVGSTLTLSARNSAVFIAFVALFVGFSGGQLWSVLAFLISTTRSTSAPQDGFYHQQQAILRNNPQPTGVAWAMLKLSSAWKGAAKKPRTRAYGFVIFSLTYVAAFFLAGVFSAKITSNDSEVRLVPVQDCGTWSYPFLSEFDPTKNTFKEYAIQRQEYWIDVNQLILTSHAHMLQCYNSTASQLNEMCLPYGRNEVSWTRHLNVSCPFAKDMCVTDAIQFDTGFMSTSFHYGIDTKEDHIEYRRVMTCAPITTEGYVSGYFNSSDMGFAVDSATYKPLDGETFLKYTYGPSGFFSDNTTYAYSNFSFPELVGWNTPSPVFETDVEFSATDPQEQATLVAPSFTAIDELSLPAADTQLIFLSRNATYLNPVHDPWFLSTAVSNTSFTFTDGSEYDMPTYIANSESPVAVMACAEQHQLRNPSNGATSRLGGMEIAVPARALELGFNANQMAVFNRSFAVGSWLVLCQVVPILGPASLLAMGSQGVYILPGLPDNQWQLEMEHYFGVTMLALQLWSQQYTLGRTPSESNNYVTPAATGFGRTMCNSQVVRRVDYGSFSVLGMAIIFVFGLLFTLANLLAAPIVERLQRRTATGRYRHAEWQTNEVLQLQRMAYEHKGIGSWTTQAYGIPRTNFGEVFTIPNAGDLSGVTPEVQTEFKGASRLFGRWSRTSSALSKTPHSAVAECVDVDLDSGEKLSPKTP